jgi:hypothetical protein
MSQQVSTTIAVMGTSRHHWQISASADSDWLSRAQEKEKANETARSLSIVA